MVTNLRSADAMDGTIAKLCCVGKQHIAIGTFYDKNMNKTPVREILASNLRTLMAAKPDLKTQGKVAAKSGVAQTSVSNMLRPNSPAMKSPKLDQVEKVARAFGLAVWQILLDRETVGRELGDMLMRPAVGDLDERLKPWDASKKIESGRRASARR